MLLLALLLQATPDTAFAIRQALARVAPVERATLDSAYRAAGWRFLWHDSRGATSSANQLSGALERVADRGLDPVDYPTSPTFVVGTPLDSTAARDVARSRAALRLARHLVRGRVEPATINRSWSVTGRPFEPSAALQRLAAAPSVSTVLDVMEPREPAYWRLRRALPGLRQQAATDPEWRPQGFPRTLRLGDTSAAVPRLRQRLEFLGDLADTASPAGTVFDAALAQAVSHFQERHGLVTDSVVGPATLEALATPLSWRVRQVELALERWRWFGDPGSAALIEVDVPNAMVHLRDSLMGAERFAGRVIVGATRTPTPLMELIVSRVVFNPAWLVPTSIARPELLPQFRADTSAFARGNYELLRAGVAVPPTPENMAAVGRTVTLRQRPGATNALGRIKLELAGTAAIHLHDTPSRRLFARDVRTLSHGCIRVDRPAELAELLLGAEWSQERIAALTTDTVTVIVLPERPVAVRLMYATATVADDGRLQFRPDRYRRDPRLDAALRNRP